MNYWTHNTIHLSSPRAEVKVRCFEHEVLEERTSLKQNLPQRARSFRTPQETRKTYSEQQQQQKQQQPQQKQAARSNTLSVPFATRSSSMNRLPCEDHPVVTFTHSDDELTRRNGRFSSNCSSSPILTDVQKSLLRFSWSRLGKRSTNNTGAMIFRRIFRKNPNVRELFGFAQCSFGQMQYDPAFVKHSRTFVNVLDDAVRNVDNLQAGFAETLRSYGRFHTSLVDRGFKPEYWDLFAEALTESAIDWEGAGRHRETIKAWTCLVSFIISEMRCGFEAEMRRKHRITMRYPSSLSESPKSLSPDRRSSDQ